MTSPEDFINFTTRELRDWIRECREQWRSENSRGYMMNEGNLDLLDLQHTAAMTALREHRHM